MDRAGTRTFGYDAAHRLASDTLTSPTGDPVASISYGYDAAGNETSKTTTGLVGAASNTYTYDDANRLTSWNDGTHTTSYDYDASGNRTSAGDKPAKALMPRRRDSGDGGMEALRVLKRRLSDVVYTALHVDRGATMTTVAA